MTTGTTAIDIPLSPRLLHAGSLNRRASSVAQQHRSIAGEVDNYSVGQRSASVEDASGDRDVPSLSTLLTFQREGGGDGQERSVPINDMGVGGGSGSASGSGSGSGRGGHLPLPLHRGGLPSSFGGSRGARNLLRGARPGSFSSGTGPGTGGRYAGSVEGADEEPLLFAMSELERDSRRSLEEGNTGEKPRGVQKKGW